MSILTFPMAVSCQEFKHFECFINFLGFATEVYDIWYPKGVSLDEPIQHVHIFVHGGYWQECTRKSCASVLNSLLVSNITG
jgi:acetyl esterase/lipase